MLKTTINSHSVKKDENTSLHLRFRKENSVYHCAANSNNYLYNNLDYKMLKFMP